MNGNFLAVKKKPSSAKDVYAVKGGSNLRRKTPIIVLLIPLLFISFFFSGCAVNVKTAVQPFKKPAAYKSRKEVLEGLAKNYGTFGGLSGRLRFTVFDGVFSASQAGIYKYIAGKYISFMILDMYGDVLFYAKIMKTKNGTEAVFLNPKDGKIKSVNLDKKYKAEIKDKTQNYERLLKVFKILLFMDKLNKIKKASVFYNTDKGFFFAYDGKCSYYICVSKKYLIRSVTLVKSGKKIESVRFKDYVLKGSGANKSMVPLKIYVDDYLYNVKMNIKLSKGSILLK